MEDTHEEMEIASERREFSGIGLLTSAGRNPF
jgi:hypothetical protein